MADPTGTTENWEEVEAGVRDALRDLGLEGLAVDVDETLADSRLEPAAEVVNARTRTVQLLEAAARYPRDVLTLQQAVHERLSAVGAEAVVFVDVDEARERARVEPPDPEMRQRAEAGASQVDQLAMELQ